MTAQIIPVPVFDLVVFGATGDLSYRKLMPALYWRERDQQMPADSRIIAVARAGMTTAAYLDKVEAACREHVDGAGFERVRIIASSGFSTTDTGPVSVLP